MMPQSSMFARLLGWALSRHGGATTDLVRLFALDRLPVRRRLLACHRRRDADGRLACSCGSSSSQRPVKAEPWAMSVNNVELVEAIGRLGLALVLGSAIGFERQ
jgi:hypothetical protein